MKKIISVILAIVLMAMPITVTANAYESAEESTTSFTKDEQTDVETNEETTIGGDEQITEPTTQNQDETSPEPNKKGLLQYILLGMIDVASVVAYPFTVSALAMCLAWPLLPVFFPFAIVTMPLALPDALLTLLYENIYGSKPMAQ